jgi:uncharacterized protein YndB with AHSA1/START domain
MTQQPFIIERILNAPVERVWKAISNKEEMKKWYFDIKDFKAEKGTKFQFEGGTKEKSFIHLCEVKEVVPLKKLKYSWAYKGYPGESFVTFELFPEGNKTKLKLTHEGLESFGNQPDFASANFEKGWTQLIGKNLPEYLAKQ